MTTIDSFAATAQGWQNFYLLTGGAAATLTGLMFLALTFGARFVTQKTLLAKRAFTDPTLFHFVYALLISCLLIAPSMNAPLLGVLLLVISASRFGYFFVVNHRFHRIRKTSGAIDRTDWIYHLILPLVGHTLLLATGLGFLFGLAISFSALAIYTVFNLFLGILVAWDTVEWIGLKTR